MRATTDKRRRQEGGFTIVEMIVTLFVMAILAGVVVPGTSKDSQRKLDVFEMQIQDAIDHAQALAYHMGEKMGVVFDVEDNWLAVINEVGTPQEDPLTRKAYVVKFTDPDQPGDIHLDYASFGSSRPLILFDSKGALLYPGELRISSGGSQRWFSVETATGQLDEIPIGS